MRDFVACIIENVPFLDSPLILGGIRQMCFAHHEPAKEYKNVFFLLYFSHIQVLPLEQQLSSKCGKRRFQKNIEKALECLSTATCQTVVTFLCVNSTFSIELSFLSKLQSPFPNILQNSGQRNQCYYSSWFQQTFSSFADVLGDGRREKKKREKGNASLGNKHPLLDQVMGKYTVIPNNQQMNSWSSNCLQNTRCL